MISRNLRQILITLTITSEVSHLKMQSRISEDKSFNPITRWEVVWGLKEGREWGSKDEEEEEDDYDPDDNEYDDSEPEPDVDPIQE